MRPQIINLSGVFSRKQKEVKHYPYPLHSLVRVNKKIKSHPNLSPEVIHAIDNGMPFYVIGQSEGDSGNPIYTISMIPYKLSEGQSIIDLLRDKYFGQEVNAKDTIKLIKLAESFSISGVEEINLEKP